MQHRTFFITLILILLTGCGQTTGSFGSPANKPDTVGVAQTNDLQPVLATSELVVGTNRVALGILENNVPIPDAAQTRVHVRYYKISGDQATLTGEEEAHYYGEHLGPRGTFIIHPTFDAPGQWGLEVQTTRPGKQMLDQRISVQVTEKGNAPMIGALAPHSKTPTVHDVKNINIITSDSKPDPRLYQISADQAVTNGKPSLILFATPGFCQTALCGPGVDVLSRLVDKFGSQVNAVHIEVYQYPFEQGKFVSAMREWNLQTEPWLFLVDRQGRIAGRFEGGITYQELEPAVAKLVQ